MTKIAVFDIDGTLYRWQLFHEVTLKLAERDYYTKAQADGIRDKYFAWQSRELPFHDFEKATVAAFEKALPTIKTKDLEQISAEIIAESGHKIYAYTHNLAKKLKREGYFLLAMSGSMQEIAEPFAKRYGFDDCIGWLYERKNGQYTGVTLRNVVGHKAQLLQEYVSEHDFALAESVGIGDSGGDIDMLEIVTRPIAFNPSEELLDAAKQNGWEIVIERKNIAYSLKEQDGLFVLAQADNA